MKKIILLGIFLISSPVFSQNDASLEETKEWLINKVNDLSTSFTRETTFFIGDPHKGEITFYNFRAYDSGDSFTLEYEYEKVYEKGTLDDAGYLFAVENAKEKLSIPWKDLILVLGPAPDDNSAFTSKHDACFIIAGKGDLSSSGTTKTRSGQDFKGTTKPFNRSRYTTIRSIIAADIDKKDVESYTNRFLNAYGHLKKFYKKQEKF